MALDLSLIDESTLDQPTNHFDIDAEIARLNRKKLAYLTQHPKIRNKRWTKSRTQSNASS